MIDLPKGLKIVYQPKGEAAEYADLGLNVYLGCTHGCTYCYCPRQLHVSKEEFFQRPEPRPNFFSLLVRDIQKLEPLAEDLPPIHISFIGDPFQPAEQEYCITRGSIRLLKQAGLCVQLLTKADYVAPETMAMLDERDWFGVTLTSWEGSGYNPFEPNAGISWERRELLEAAKAQGCNTWVSVEPIMDVGDLEKIVRQTQVRTDHYKFGPLNYGKRDYTLAHAARGARHAVSGWGYDEGPAVRGKRTFYLKKSLRDAEAQSDAKDD